LFKQSLPNSDTNEFNANPLLFKVDVDSNEFSERDWANSPRVEYASALYQKLAPPRTARVVDDSSGFKLETYGATHKEDHLEQVSSKELEISSSENNNYSKNVNQALTQELNLDDELRDNDEIKNKLDLKDLSLDQETAEKNSYNGEKIVNQTLSEQDLPLEAFLSEQNCENIATSIESLNDSIGNSNFISDQDQEELSEAVSSEINSDINDSLSNVSDVISEAAEEESKDLHSGVYAQGSLAELSELKIKYEDKNKVWNDERLQLTQKLEEAQNILEDKEKEYLENIELIEKNSNEKISSQLDILKEITNRVEEYTKTPDRLFEPMKRLSMHIAEQLVLAELNLSGSSIERLIQRCLDELSNRAESSVIVELNVQDKARLEELSGEATPYLQLRGVPGLQAGSVRVISDDTQVDDLITNRLEGLAHSLLGQPEIWKEKSPFFRQPLAQRESDVQDVRQRITAPDDTFEGNFND
jgi:hypothetical protein